MHADRQEHHQRQHRHQKHDREHRRPDGYLADPQQLVDQRREGAPKHEPCDAHQDDVVHQQKEFPRKQFKAAGRVKLRRPPCVQRQGTADRQDEEGENIKPTGRVGCERMHRHQDAGAHQESSHQAQGECKYRQQQRPTLEDAALLGDAQRMDQCRSHQPGHERCVFDRIPEPPSTPAELVVGPPAAERDTDGLKQPREYGPGPGPFGPGLIETAFEHRGDGERESHREAHVPGVEHRRVNREREILQHGIQIRAVRGGRYQAHERIRSPQREQHETAAD